MSERRLGDDQGVGASAGGLDPVRYYVEVLASVEVEYRTRRGGGAAGRYRLARSHEGAVYVVDEASWRDQAGGAVVEEEARDWCERCGLEARTYGYPLGEDFRFDPESPPPRGWCLAHLGELVLWGLATALDEGDEYVASVGPVRMGAG